MRRGVGQARVWDGMCKRPGVGLSLVCPWSGKAVRVVGVVELGETGRRAGGESRPVEMDVSFPKVTGCPQKVLDQGRM